MAYQDYSISKVFLFIQQINQLKVNLAIRYHLSITERLNKALIHYKVIEVIILIVTSSVPTSRFRPFVSPMKRYGDN